MQITIRADSVELEGYVNSIERKSKPLWSRIGQFVERICKGAFKRALERNDNVRIMLNHTKDIGGQRDGNLVGWSFGFYDREVEQKRDENGYPLRDVIDLDLEEVSILDNRTTPAYDGTLVAVRSDEKSIYYGESFTDEIQLRELEEVPKQQETVEKDKHHEEYKKLLEEMKEE